MSGRPRSAAQSDRAAAFVDAHSPQMPARVELKIASDPANLRNVRTVLEDFSNAAGMSQEDCNAIGLAVNEALANVMRHGYGGAKDKPIIVTAEALNGEVVITIRDWARPFDPKTLPEKKVDPRNLTPGGLGLICIRQLMDEVQYSPLADGMLLRLTKKRSRS